MDIYELQEIYKKDKLFVSYHSLAESDLNQLSLLLQKYKESDDRSKHAIVYPLEQLKSQVAETAWIYFIYQCKKLIDESQSKEMLISNKSNQYKDCIAYMVENDKKRNNFIVFPEILDSLNLTSLAFEKKNINAESFADDIFDMMLESFLHVSVIKERINNFIKFSTFCEKYQIEQSLFNLISTANIPEQSAKKRL